VGALRLLAEVEAEREDYVEAERLLGECLTLAPGYSDARFDLARVLHSQQKAAPMLPLLERLLALEPDNFRFRTLQASAYNLLGQNDRAQQIQEQMLTEFPESELLWLYYGHSLRIAGRLEEAVAAYRQSTRLKPQFGEAWFSLANLKTVRFSDEDIATMQAQAARVDLEDDSRLQFEFALGKAFEDQRIFAASFEHYARGNALRRAMVRYEADGFTRFVQRVCALYAPEFFAARAGTGNPAPDPIFVVGLPRSGSTLLEQILASHSQVEGTRELPDIPGFALELGALERPGKPPAYPASVAQLDRAQLTALGDRYPRADPSAPGTRQAALCRQDAGQLQSRRPDSPAPAECEDHRCAPWAARLLLCQFQAAFSVRRLVYLQPRGSRPLLPRLCASDEAL